MAAAAAVTALPYVDTEFDDPTVRDAVRGVTQPLLFPHSSLRPAQVLKLIEAEKATFRPDLEAYLVHLPKAPHFNYEVRLRRVYSSSGARGCGSHPAGRSALRCWRRSLRA